MPLEINMQFNIVFYSLISGFIAGVLFDVYRIIRDYNSIKIIIAIEDILFWILTGLIVFTFLLSTNYAFLTPYVYIFMSISLIVYLRFLSRYFYKIEKTIVNEFIKIIRIVIKNLMYPLKIILYKVTDKRK